MSDEEYHVRHATALQIVLPSASRGAIRLGCNDPESLRDPVPNQQQTFQPEGERDGVPDFPELGKRVAIFRDLSRLSLQVNSDDPSR